MQKSLYTVFLLISVICLHAQTAAPRKIKSVEKKPYNYALPSIPISSNTKALDEPWVVYSDRNENPVYSDKSLSRTIAKVQFLDSFFVAAIAGDAFELIKYNSSNIESINKITDPGKIEYVGWIDRSHLLLNTQCLVHNDSKLALKYITMMNGSKAFDQFKKYTIGDRIKLFSDPDMIMEGTGTFASFNEIVYTYKELKDKVLIGISPAFSASNARSVILGWVQKSFIQCWGTRLCIEPMRYPGKDTMHYYLFPTLNHAFKFKINPAAGVPLKNTDCGNHLPWTAVPVFSSVNYKIDNVSYKVLQTGSVIKPFDHSEAYIFNVNGSKITYQDLCNLTINSKKLNIVFVMNLGDDTKEYMSVFLNGLQDLDQYFKEKSEFFSARYGLYDCTNPNGNDNKLHNTYADILPKLISITKESVKNKKTADAYGVLNGLSKAGSYFKNREKETNIIVMISNKGDEASENVYKSKSRNLADHLASYNVRVVFFQPYAAAGEKYASFISQAKIFLEKSSESITPRKRVVQVGNNIEKIYSNTFRSVESGSTNVYCLDYPQNSSHQGYIVFPTVGNKTESKYLSNSIDSLLYQIQSEHDRIIGSISSVFNSPGIFNNKINENFRKFYSINEPVPSDAEGITRNINFNYFAEGYTVSPNNGNPYYKQSLLLSKEEYEEMYRLFKSLRFDLLLENNNESNRRNCYNEISKAMNSFAARQDREANKNMSLADFLYLTCGYNSPNKSLQHFYISYLTGEMPIKKEQFDKMLEYINGKLSKFYSASNNTRLIYYCRNSAFYIIPEDYLP